MASDTKLLSEDAVEELLGDWQFLNEQLKTLSLPAVAQLLAAEVRGRRRQVYLRRLYGRYNKLRYAPELDALLKGLLWPVIR